MDAVAAEARAKQADNGKDEVEQDKVDKDDEDVADSEEAGEGEVAEAVPDTVRLSMLGPSC